MFPKVKFLCDGSVQNLEIGLFYTTKVNDVWETVLSAELLLLSSGGNYRQCSKETLNCIKIYQNWTDSDPNAENAFLACRGICIKFRSNTIQTVSVNFSSPRYVKRGDYLGLVVAPLDRSFEDGLPVIYMGKDYESPFIAIPPGSFSPSCEFNVKYTTAEYPCSAMHCHNITLMIRWE